MSKLNTVHAFDDPEAARPKNKKEMVDYGKCYAICCIMTFAIIFTLGSMAMTGLGIFYIADNAAVAAAPNPIDGWTALPAPSTGYVTNTTIYTGLCDYNVTYLNFTVSCTYPAVNNNTCGIPENTHTYYKARTYPPEFHCGEIKSNEENIHKRNMGIILLVVPYAFTVLLVLAWAILNCALSCGDI